MQVWDLATGLELPRQALTVLLSLERKAKEARLELDIITLNTHDDMEKLYEKLDTLFLEDVNHSPLWHTNLSSVTEDMMCQETTYLETTSLEPQGTFTRASTHR